MEVHREPGPGLDERFYHALLKRKLERAGIAHESRARRELAHRGIVADVFEPDLAFPGRMIAALKCLTGAFAGEHFVQLLCSVKFWKIATGLPFDFAKESLVYRRVEFREPVFELPSLTEMESGQPDQVLLSSICRSVCEAVRKVAAEYGLGYRDTTYAGLLRAELCHAGVGCVNGLSVDVKRGNESLGTTALPRLIVGEKFALKVLALRRSITAADLASLRTHLRLAGAQVGRIMNFDRSSIGWRWVAANTTAATTSHSNPSPS
jgi:GxxExxY protein